MLPRCKCIAVNICSALPDDCDCRKFKKLVVENANSLQQLKAEILPMLCEASESLRIGDIDDGERIVNEIAAKLSAV